MPLTATVTSSAGTVNEGTETFTLFSGATPIGSPVTVNVANGARQCELYCADRDRRRHVRGAGRLQRPALFVVQRRCGHHLTISSVPTQTLAVSTTATFSAIVGRTVTLLANVLAITARSTRGSSRSSSITSTALRRSTTTCIPLTSSTRSRPWATRCLKVCRSALIRLRRRTTTKRGISRTPRTPRRRSRSRPLAPALQLERDRQLQPGDRDGPPPCQRIDSRCIQRDRSRQWGHRGVHPLAQRNHHRLGQR